MLEPARVLSGFSRRFGQSSGSVNPSAIGDIVHARRGKSTFRGTAAGSLFVVAVGPMRVPVIRCHCSYYRKD
jgi:hypothetical protein